LRLIAGAVPTGILAVGFTFEIRRRDFTVNWRAVARVPFFAGLDCARASPRSHDY
jgi:voltage-gated potassium channel